MSRYEFFVPTREESLSKREWTRVLEGIRFPGNANVAGGFLEQVQQGIAFVREEMKNQGITLDPVCIAITLQKPGDGSPHSFCYNYGPHMDLPKYDHVVQVPGQVLILSSKYGKRKAHPSAKDDITRDAVYDEFWFLGGVEEADHARFRQLHGKPEKSSAGISDLVEYDAQQHEYEALFTRLRAATARKVPAISIAAIETRIRLAQLWRAERGIA